MNPSTRPNLVFILADQLRLDACGFSGRCPFPTPALDRLASQSVQFTNAVSSTPVCSAYRASLFTGKYTTSTGMVINELRIHPGHRCLGHVLGDAGYDTAYIGKWHLYGRNHSDEEQFCPPGPYRLGFDGLWAAHNFHHRYFEGFYFGDSFRRIEIDGFEPDAQTTMGIRFLREAGRGENPFGLFVCYGVPHDPWEWWNVPEQDAAPFREVPAPDPPNYADGSAEYWDPKFDHAWWMREVRPRREQHRRVYHAMVRSLDRQVACLLGALDESGLSGNTIVVFASDHGDMAGAHGRIQKAIFYEEAVRTPLLVRWPDRIPPGTRTDVCGAAPDMMPTLLGLMNQPIPEEVEGTDLSAHALGQGGDGPGEAFLQGTGHTYLWLDGFEWRAVRSKTHTYAVTPRDGAEYLFDNGNDPWQLTNLAGRSEAADVLAHCRRRLDARMTELGDTFESCTWYRDHWTEDRCIVR